jgi:hypothetical protein
MRQARRTLGQHDDADAPEHAHPLLLLLLLLLR